MSVAKLSRHSIVAINIGHQFSCAGLCGTGAVGVFALYRRAIDHVLVAALKAPISPPIIASLTICLILSGDSNGSLESPNPDQMIFIRIFRCPTIFRIG
jgi:hypothetical protein